MTFFISRLIVFSEIVSDGVNVVDKFLMMLPPFRALRCWRRAFAKAYFLQLSIVPFLCNERARRSSLLTQKWYNWDLESWLIAVIEREKYNLVYSFLSYHQPLLTNHSAFFLCADRNRFSNRDISTVAKSIGITGETSTRLRVNLPKLFFLDAPNKSVLHFKMVAQQQQKQHFLLLLHP